ncbi:MAG: tetratricopeptide repeat protein [Treponemataceae bacterium]|nr:tetratricopeptide repeat protein [Treponemataceae bacterium]
MKINRFFNLIMALMMLTLIAATFSCVSAPKKGQSAEEQFAEKLKYTLEHGSNADALLLFDDMPIGLKRNYDINLLHASLLISEKRLDEAAQVADLLEKIDPDNSENLVIRSLIAKQKGDKKTKTALLKEILKNDPKNSDAYVELGNDYMLGKRYKAAASFYSKAVENDPANISAYLGYGQCLYYMDRIPESRQAFDRMLEINPKSSIAWSYQAKLDMEDEKYSIAREKLEKAIKYDAAYQDYWIDYGRCSYYMGQFDKAEEAWDKAVSLDSENFAVYVYRSSLYDEQGRFDEAINDYLKIIELKPNYFYAYEALGIIYYFKQDWEKSRKAFEYCYKSNPNNDTYALMVSANYIRQNKYAENKKFMSQALRNKDIMTVPGSVMRLYFDGINLGGVTQKVLNESNPTVRGRFLFYVGLYNEVSGDDLTAKKYYTEVIDCQVPMSFEYRIAEWNLKNSSDEADTKKTSLGR